MGALELLLHWNVTFIISRRCSFLQFKIDESGLISGDLPTGTWGMGELVADNSSWTMNIPASLAPGEYFLRHEVIMSQRS